MSYKSQNIAVYSGSFNPLHIGHLAIIRHMIEVAGFDMVYLIVSPKNPLKDGISSDSGRERYKAAVEAVERRFLRSGLSASGRNDSKAVEAECVDDMPPPARGRERFSKRSCGPLQRAATEGKAGVIGASASTAASEARVKVDDIELNMPEPHYTIRTLDALKEREPDNRFTLVMGADNLADIRRWRDYTRILKEFGVAVFPREGHDLTEIKQDLLKEDPAYKIQILDAEMVDISSTQIREAIARGEDISHCLM
ncbi:MAG: nicotinate-nicotinamide nucleotide adenylyltransferase [Bacteroidales bacterium]|nr:nicotinate-nicotinamide nucleotide adenylyltransferase [Bacteroidales bacterium]